MSTVFISWMKKVGALVRLSELNIKQSDLPLLADKVIAVTGSVHNNIENIQPLKQEDILAILEKIY